jgi:hypothetical protein
LLQYTRCVGFGTNRWGAIRTGIFGETCSNGCRTVGGFGVLVKFQFGSVKAAADTKFQSGKVCFNSAIQHGEITYHPRIEEFGLFTKVWRSQNQDAQKLSLI